MSRKTYPTAEQLQPEVMSAEQARIALAKPKNKEIGMMKLYLRHAGIAFVEEYKFVEQRRFKFDIAIPDKMIAIEYEGLIYKNMRGKSGHTTVTGYTSNCEKYNLATLAGWRVLRYTAMNYKSMMDDVRKLIVEV